jgi:hypothetical protein
MTSAFMFDSGTSRRRSRPEPLPAGTRLRQDWAAGAGATPRHAARRAVRRDYRVLSSLAFIIFLVVAAVARLLPERIRSHICGTCEPRSIVADARAMVASTIAIAFSA